jgi:plastocyanin
MITTRRMRSRRWLLLAATVLILTLAAWPVRAADALVDIVDFAFQPATLTVGLNSTIVWTNRDVAAHTVTFSGGPDSGVLNTGNTYSRTFASAGTYNYRCEIHPSMTGTVTVLDVPLEPRAWLPLIINEP